MKIDSRLLATALIDMYLQLSKEDKKKRARNDLL